MNRLIMATTGAGAILTACTPLIPPADHIDTLPAMALAAERRSDLDASCCMPGASVSHGWAPNERIVLEGSGQLQPNAGGIGAAVWLRSADKGAARAALRAGVNGGTGDVFGFVPWEMPYVGGSLHGQIAGPFARETSRWAITTGVGYSAPLDSERVYLSDATVTAGDGTTTTVPVYGYPETNIYGDLEARLEMGSPVAFTVGLAWRQSSWGVGFPRASLGLAF